MTPALARELDRLGVRAQPRPETAGRRLDA